MKHQQKQISLLGCAVKISYGAEVIILIRMGVLKYSLNFIAIGILISVLEKNTNAAFESNFERLYDKIYPYEFNANELHLYWERK